MAIKPDAAPQLASKIEALRKVWHETFNAARSHIRSAQELFGECDSYLSQIADLEEFLKPDAPEVPPASGVNDLM